MSISRKSTVKNMTEGSPAKLIFFFALPLMAGNVFQQLYTVVDTAVVGKVLGVDALAALGSVDWLNWLVLGMIQGITQGFAIPVAQKFGAGDYRELRRTTGNAVILSAAAAVLLTILAQLLLTPAIWLLKVPKDIQYLSVHYLRVMFSGTVFIMAYNMEASILRALGDGRSPLIACVIASLVNIVLDCLFVIGFGWGVEGAAVATLISQLLAAVYCFGKIRSEAILRRESEEEKSGLDGGICKNLVKLSTPMAFQNLVISIGGMIVQTVVNGFGVAFIAGFVAVNKLYGLLEIAAISYGFAMVTYTGQNVGAGKKERVSGGLRSGMLIALLTSLVISIVMLVFGRFILQMFISADAANGEEALRVAYYYLKIMSIFLMVLYVLHVVRSTIQGMGNTVVPMLSGISEFTMRTGSALLLPLLFGEKGILFAELMAWVGADLVLIPGYFYLRKRL